MLQSKCITHGSKTQRSEKPARLAPHYVAALFGAILNDSGEKTVFIDDYRKVYELYMAGDYDD